MAPRKETVQAKTSFVAILLADTFHQIFDPVSVECSSILLPLVNVPLVEYSLEWLAANEVDEVLVFCSSHSDQIMEYFAKSKWSASSEFMKVHLVKGKGCVSVGDALRFIDQLHIIKSDCLILTGDTVTNLNLKPALEAHRERRKDDADAIMTMVVAPGKEDQGDVMLVDSKSKRLLQMKEAPRKLKTSANLVVDASLFSERDSIEIRKGFANSEVYICAPKVLMLFSDNFDYQTLHEDFIAGVLSEEELGNKIFIHEGQGQYVQRVKTWRWYDNVSRDILFRWTFPFSPDTRIFSSVQSHSYLLQRSNHYLSSDLRLPLTVELKGTGICVGSNTFIGDFCEIEKSVIGQNCRLETGVFITGSYIHNGVKIGSKAKIINSLICSQCVVHSGAVIQDGCVLSFGVVISPLHTVPAHTLLTLCPTKQEDEQDSEPSSPVAAQKEADQLPEEKALEAASLLKDLSISRNVSRPSYFEDKVVGTRGAGCQWPHPNKSNFKFYSIAKPPPLNEFIESENEESEIESTASHGDEKLDPDQLFQKEVVDTFLRCVYHKFSKENVVLELNGLKLAELRSFVDCANFIFTTLLQMCMPPPDYISPIYRSLFAQQNLNLQSAKDQKQFLESLKKLLEEWSPVLQRFLKDEDDQVELMFTFEEFYKGEGVFSISHSWGSMLSPMISHVCHLLYDNDIITEDAFLTWASEKDQATDEEDKVFHQKTKPFLDWLNEAEESDSSE